MSRQIDWRDASTLHSLSSTEALQVLGMIAEHFSHPRETQDQSHDQLTSTLIDDQRFRLDVSKEAQEFCDSANRLGSRLRSAKDCRPQLRQAADARRDEEKKETDPAAEFAANAKRFHRKGAL